MYMKRPGEVDMSSAFDDPMKTIGPMKVAADMTGAPNIKKKKKPTGQSTDVKYDQKMKMFAPYIRKV